MRFRVDLFDGPALRGSVEFERLLVQSELDYHCEPPDLLSFGEVVELSRDLRRLPALERGVLGRYHWRERV